MHIVVVVKRALCQWQVCDIDVDALASRKMQQKPGSFDGVSVLQPDGKTAELAMVVRVHVAAARDAHVTRTAIQRLILQRRPDNTAAERRWSEVAAAQGLVGGFPREVADVPRPRDRRMRKF